MEEKLFRNTQEACLHMERTVNDQKNYIDTQKKVRKIQSK
jgi:hypothetical protein